MSQPTLPGGNPKPPEHINNAHNAPVKDLLALATGVLLALLLATLALAYSARWIAPFIPYQWERDLFNDAHVPFEQSSAEDTAHTENDAQADAKQQALQQLMDRLTAHQPDRLPVTVHYLSDMDIPNAFATLGGHVFVSAGLLRSVDSENGLAMVMAHEYSHVQQRHPLKLALEQLTVSMMISLVTGDTAGLAQLTSSVTLLSFSRDMERDADRDALLMLQQHYGHTQGAEEFFEKMLDQHGESRWQTVFQTHPMTSERLAVIAKQKQVTSSKAQLTALPSELQIKSHFLNTGKANKETE